MAIGNLKLLCNVKVVYVVFDEDMLSLTFIGDMNLAIYNRYFLIGFSKSESYLLIGDTISDIKEINSFLIVMFSSGLKIKVDMRDEAYRGPEALQLSIPGEPIMVWN